VQVLEPPFAAAYLPPLQLVPPPHQYVQYRRRTISKSLKTKELERLPQIEVLQQLLLLFVHLLLVRCSELMLQPVRLLLVQLLQLLLQTCSTPLLLLQP
jgi:hypothetical protein